MVASDRRDVWWTNREDEVTRTELVGWTGTRIRELQRSTRREISETVRRQECVREKQKEQLNSLDEADFVRDVEKSAYHHLSHNETLQHRITEKF